jgi:glycosyltransferase involved in cell wall biosynthesis
MNQELFQPVTVVIPHRGQDASLQKCVQAIRDQDYPREKIRVLIVINEQEGRELSFQLKTGEEVLFQTKNFSYAARNLGISVATTEIIALTDSDTVPSEQWLSQGVKSIIAGADLVAGGILLTYSSERRTAAGLYEQLFAFDQEKNVRLGQSVTANLFAAKQNFDKFGYFDENARSGEDFEWTKSAVNRGALLTYNPLASVKHPARENVGELFKKTLRTTWFFPQAPKGQSTSYRVLSRAWGQLTMRPSQPRIQSMRILDRVIAHSVRAALIGLKAFLLAGYFARSLFIRILRK